MPRSISTPARCATRSSPSKSRTEIPRARREAYGCGSARLDNERGRGQGNRPMSSARTLATVLRFAADGAGACTVDTLLPLSGLVVGLVVVVVTPGCGDG